jgi:hypothetical protein
MSLTQTPKDREEKRWDNANKLHQAAPESADATVFHLGSSSCQLWFQEILQRFVLNNSSLVQDPIPRA